MLTSLLFILAITMFVERSRNLTNKADRYTMAGMAIFTAMLFLVILYTFLAGTQYL